MTDQNRPLKAGPDPDYRVTNDDLDRIAARRAEQALEAQFRGELAFAHLVGQAPSLVSALQKLKGAGRA